MKRRAFLGLLAVPMAKYLFSKREDVESLLKLVDSEGPLRLPGSRVRREGVLTTGWLFKTPAGGIPARDGVRCGRAECVPYYLKGVDVSGQLELDIEELTDNEGTSITVEVFNIFSSDIGGDAYITAKEIYKRLVADAEDCGSGGGEAAPAQGGAFGASYGETI